MEVGFGGAFLAVGVLLVIIIVGAPLLIHYSSRKTTQHAPHTPRRKTTQHASPTPLWRQILSLPHTRLGWWAVGLAGIALQLTAFTNVMGFANTDNPELSILGASVSWGGDVLIPLVFLTWSLSGVAGLVVALIALLRGQERSALVWVAMVPGLPALWPLVFTVLVLLDSMGEISKLWGMIALAGLIGVLIVWLQRHR